MEKRTDLEFEEIMDFYDAFFPGKSAVRTDRVLKSVTPDTVAGRIREAMRLSELFIWKKRSRR